jgi:hypothetical protein
MAKYNFDKDKFEEWKRALREGKELQDNMNQSLGGYLEGVKKIGELQKNILAVEKQISNLKKEQSEYEDEIRRNGVELNNLRRAGYTSSSNEVKNIKLQNQQLRQKIAAQKQMVSLGEEELNSLKKRTDELAKQANSASLISASFGSAVGFLGKVPNLIKSGYGKLKGTGIFEMDKEIRNAVRSMAGGQKTYNNMFKTLSNASETTTMMGVGIKDLAIMQRGYSEEIGRSVMLTEKGYEAMAGLAEGTGLGKEFAVQFAGSMDKFNVSAEASAKVVESTMNKAAKLGVNGAAAIKSLQQNLKLAQRFNFKNGIDGLKRFSIEAARLRLDVEGIAGMMESVFRPEGAIEMAAQLTTLGGKFASLGDPMQLMFKARNDPEGFAKDIGKVSSEFVEMNQKTGVFSIKGGLAADRMREIAKVTGLSVEKLQEMATAQAKVESVSKDIRIANLKDEDRDIITSLAKFEKGKGFVVNLDGRETLVKDLRKVDLQRLRDEDKTLKQRAEDARTFDETIQDLILLFKQQLFPFAKTLKDEFGDKIIQLGEWFKSSEFKKLLNGLIVKLQEFVGFLSDWVSDNPVKSSILAGSTIFAGVIGKAATWFANGVALAMGFNSMVAAGGLMSRGGSFGTGVISNMASKGGIVGKIGTNASKLGKVGMGVAGVGGLVGGIAGDRIGSSLSDYEDSGAGSIGSVVGSTALGALGMAFGGPVGMMLGSAIGAGIGRAAGNYFTGNKKESNPNIVGTEDGIIKFHPQDKFMQVGSNTMLASTQKGQLDKAATKLTGGNSSGVVTHKFEDIKINVNVTAPTDEKIWREIFNSPEIMRRLTSEIHIATQLASSGGKTAGKPKKID